MQQDFDNLTGLSGPGCWFSWIAKGIRVFFLFMKNNAIGATTYEI